MRRGIPFVTALLAGVMCLLVLGGGDTTFQTAVIATVLVMSAYLAWILWSQRAVRTYERYADSFYYLGFMLTLSALLVALLGGATREGLGLSEVLTKFGLGLVTTLVGLAGRIALIEFSGGVEETAEDALIQVRHSADRLAIELDLAGRSLRDANSAMAEAARQQQQAISRAIEENVQSIVGGFADLRQSLIDTKGTVAEATSELMTHINTTLSGGLDEVLATAKSVAEDTGRITTAAAKGIAQALVRLNQEIGRLNVPPDLLRDTFSKALSAASGEFLTLQNEIQKLAKLTASLGEALEGVRQRTEKANQAIAGVETLGSALTQIGERAARVGLAINAMQNSLAQLSEAVTANAKGVASSATDLQRQLADQLEAIRRLRAQLEQDVRHSADAVRQVHQSLVENTKFITDKLGV